MVKHLPHTEFDQTIIKAIACCFNQHATHTTVCLILQRLEFLKAKTQLLALNDRTLHTILCLSWSYNQMEPLPGLVSFIQRSSICSPGCWSYSLVLVAELAGMVFSSSVTGWYKSTISASMFKVRRCQGKT